MSDKDEVPVMILNRACKNFFLCSNYEIPASDEARRAGLNRPHFLTGCPSLHEEPDECKFYKEMCRFIEINRRWFSRRK